MNSERLGIATSAANARATAELRHTRRPKWGLTRNDAQRRRTGRVTTAPGSVAGGLSSKNLVVLVRSCHVNRAGSRGSVHAEMSWR